MPETERQSLLLAILRTTNSGFAHNKPFRMGCSGSFAAHLALPEPRKFDRLMLEWPLSDS